MKLYALCTPSHKVFRDRWFLPSLQDDFDLRILEWDHPGSGYYGAPDFCLAVRRKVGMIREAIDAGFGRVFVACDLDIQFFGPVKDILLRELRGRDLVAQDDGEGGYGCGFMVLRANTRTRLLFDLLNARLARDPRLLEQPTFNRCLRETQIRIGFLPDIFFGPAISGWPKARHRSWPWGWLARRGLRSLSWHPGCELILPPGIRMHHANWTRGIENKLAQLEYVRGQVLGIPQEITPGHSPVPLSEAGR